MFTAGQASRINSALTMTRPTLSSSLGCMAPVGMQDVTLASQVSVYPNPSTGQITLTGTLKNRGNVEIRILSMLGEMVYVKELKNASDIKESIDLSGIAPGVYTFHSRARKE
jgi:hypothetical protein